MDGSLCSASCSDLAGGFVDRAASCNLSAPTKSSTAAKQCPAAGSTYGAPVCLSLSHSSTLNRSKIGRAHV